MGEDVDLWPARKIEARARRQKIETRFINGPTLQSGRFCFIDYLSLVITCHW